jgi:hypothetical protein
MVEGLALTDDEALHHAVEGAKHIARRDPDDLDALAGQPRITGCVSLRVFAHVMRHAVDLDTRERCFAIEIEHVGTGGVLATEFQAAGPGAEGSPEEDFRQGHGAAEGAGLFDRWSSWAEHRIPFTILRMVPLP